MDPGSAEQWPVPAVPGRLQLATAQTSASESYSGLAPGRRAQEEEGKALEVDNEYSIKMPHMRPRTG